MTSDWFFPIIVLPFVVLFLGSLIAVAIPVHLASRARPEWKLRFWISGLLGIFSVSLSLAMLFGSIIFKEVNLDPGLTICGSGLVGTCSISLCGHWVRQALRNS